MKRRNLFLDHLLAAVSFLTRVPLPGADKLEWTQELLLRSLVHYPTIGWFFGLAQVLLVMAGTWLRLDNSLVAFFLLVLPFCLNRFLHFDGLADVLDGFLADRKPEERLEIMKDSRNGSFALGGAILFVLGKYILLLNLLALGWSAIAVVWIAPIVARWLVSPMAYKARYPRAKGTGLAIVGQVDRRGLARSGWAALVAVVLALTLGIALAGWQALVWLSWHNLAIAIAVGVAALASVGWMLALRRISERKIGGVTGDVLGCLIESAEWLFLAAAFLALQLLR